MSFFDLAKEYAPDPIFGLAQTFKQDKNPHKVDLMVGVYRDENMQCVQMPSIEEGAKEWLDQHASPNYLPFLGDEEYIEATGKLLFGDQGWSQHRSNIVGSQGIGGTGTLHNGALLLKTLGYTRVHISDPTWANHNNIFSLLGFQIESYPYFDVASNTFTFEKMMEYFKHLKTGDVVLLHTSCHNPSGRDPSKEEWELIAKQLEKQKALPFFDTAYQGFKEGLEEDAYPVRLFLERGMEFISTQSFSKNFSLYNQRTSSLFVTSKDKDVSKRVESTLKKLIRSSYSNPPAFGASVVKTILTTPHLKSQWEDQLTLARKRLINLKEKLKMKLEEMIPQRDWSHLSLAHGMFVFIGLNPSVVKQLREKHAIYMTGQGRMNISGINDKNIDYIVHSIAKELS